MDDAQRFLDLVCRELQCADAYFQLGGQPPGAAERIAVELDTRWWLVARFDAAPDDPEAPRVRLEALVKSFSGLTDGAGKLRALLPGTARGVAYEARTEIDEALRLLADKAGAPVAVVIDEDSPVLWGSSDASGDTDVEAAIALAELVDSAAKVELDLTEMIGLDDAALAKQLDGLASDKLRQRLLRKLPVIRERAPQRSAEQWATHVLACQAIAAVRRAPERRKAMLDELGWLAREFGGIYHVILVFDGPFDELHATPPLQRALPAIEKLVLALPPVDPPPRTARALRLI